MKVLNNTKTVKKHYGWSCSTTVQKNDYSYEVSTNKQSDGKIRSTAQRLLNDGQSGIISFTMFSNDKDHRIILKEINANATENNVYKCHCEALTIFENYELSSHKPLEPGVNTIFWMDGYGHYKGEIGNEYICYEIEKTKWGTYYKCVEPTNLNFISIDHPRHESKMFGIGHYYSEDYIFNGDQNMLNDIIIDAHNATKLREAAEAEAVRVAKIEADAKEKELSKYTRADVRKTGQLLKNYAKSLGIKTVSVRYDSFSMGNSYDIEYHATENNETFENLCNSLQTASYNAYEDYWDSKAVEPVILENHILRTFKYVHVKFVKDESIETFQEVKAISINDIHIEDYSDKAIVLRGDTKPIKDQLKAAGGTFNFKLKGGPVWIFSKKRESEIRQLFNI